MVNRMQEPDYFMSLSTQDKQMMRALLERFDKIEASFNLEARLEAGAAAFHKIDQLGTRMDALHNAAHRHEGSRLYRALRFVGLLGENQ